MVAWCWRGGGVKLVTRPEIGAHLLNIMAGDKGGLRVDTGMAVENLSQNFVDIIG